MPPAGHLTSYGLKETGSLPNPPFPTTPYHKAA
jgi:hypothetical protein